MDTQGFVKNVVISQHQLDSSQRLPFLSTQYKTEKQKQLLSYEYELAAEIAGIEVQFNQVENVIGQIFAP